MDKRLVVTMLAFVLLGACSSGNDDDGAVIVRRTTAGTPRPTATAAVAGRILERPTVAELRQGLLTVADLPSGYGETASDGNDDGPLSCPANDRSRRPERVAHVEIGFSKGVLGPLVSEALDLFEDEATAEEAMDEFRGALIDCPSTQQADASGNVWTFSSGGRLSFPKLGDETLALRLHVEGPVSVSGDLVYVRRGALVMLVGHLGVLGVDPGDTEAFTKKADQRVLALP